MLILRSYQILSCEVHREIGPVATLLFGDGRITSQAAAHFSIFFKIRCGHASIVGVFVGDPEISESVVAKHDDSFLVVNVGAPTRTRT